MNRYYIAPSKRYKQKFLIWFKVNLFLCRATNRLQQVSALAHGLRVAVLCHLQRAILNLSLAQKIIAMLNESDNDLEEAFTHGAFINSSKN